MPFSIKTLAALDLYHASQKIDCLIKSHDQDSVDVCTIIINVNSSDIRKKSFENSFVRSQVTVVT